MSAGVIQLSSVIKGSRVWSEHDVKYFLEAQTTLSTCVIICGSSVHDLPLYPKLPPLLLQLPDVRAESGGCLHVYMVEVILMFVPAFLEGVSSQPCIVFNNIVVV